MRIPGLRRLRFAQTNETQSSTGSGTADSNFYIYQDWTGGNNPATNDVKTVQRTNNYGGSP